MWIDTNRDGQQDEGEAPVEGVTVNLYDAEGNLVKTTTTDANGFYSFTDLLAGADYTIEFIKPDGTVFTGQNAGDDATDSDANPADGKVAITAPATGNNSATQPDDPTIDAGLIELVSVGDYVWMDVDRDGQQDKGEAPVEGVTVNLYDASGNLVKTTTTDANGFYSFTDLLAGAEYTIEFVKPDGTNFTGQNIGADGTDSDADFGTGKVTFTAPATGNNSATQPDDPTIDAGLVLFNLILDKKLVSSPRVQVGDNVTFTLTPHNEGPANALAGWSVTEVLPEGLELVSMTGDGYTCEGVTCTAADILAAGADGPVITVVAKVVAAGQQHNVAYVSPHKDDVPETNPLGPPPPPGTDTDGTDTDNDSQAEVGGWLAHTGLELGLLAGTGLGLVGIGGVLMLGRRRRPEAAGKHRIS